MASRLQYVKRQGFRFSLQFTQCQQEAADSLPELKSCPNLSCDQLSQSCSAGGKIAPGVYILPHKAK